jgi:hypothetical protein
MFDWPEQTQTSPIMTFLNVTGFWPFTVSVCGPPGHPSAARVGLGRSLGVAQREGDLLPGACPAPNRNGPFALQHHVVAEHARQGGGHGQRGGRRGKEKKGEEETSALGGDHKSIPFRKKL